MPTTHKEVNKTIGHVACSHCATRADVRQDRKGKLYYACPECGHVMPRLAKFQAWIRAHAKFTTAPAAEQKPASTTSPAPRSESNPTRSTPKKTEDDGLDLTNW